MSVPPTQLRDATTVTETTPTSSAQTTTPISAAHHEHTISILTQTFSPLASFSDVTPSSPTQSVGPSSPALPQPSGPSSATQLEDLVRDIEVGDHGRGRGRGRGTKRPQPDMPVVLKRNPPRNKRKPCCGTK